MAERSELERFDGNFQEPAEALGADSAPRNTTAAPVSKDDLDTAMEALDARHWEDAELLAEEVRRQAAADGDAAREAAALRVVTKAQVRAATGISETPDIEILRHTSSKSHGYVLEKALKAFALEKNGELVAQAIMQLHSAEIYVAMDRHAEALRFAQQAWSIFQQACTFYESMGDARNAASAACKADKAYKLIKGSQASALNVTLLNTQLADAEERNLQNIKALHTLEEKLLETQSMRDMFFKEAEMYRNELEAALMELKVSRDEKTLLEEDLKQLKAQVVLSSAKASGDPVKVNLGGLCLWRAP